MTDEGQGGGDLIEMILSESAKGAKLCLDDNTSILVKEGYQFQEEARLSDSEDKVYFLQV